MYQLFPLGGSHLANPIYPLSVGETRWLDEREARAWRTLQMMQMRLDGELARQLASESGLSYQDYTVLVALTGRAEGRMVAEYEARVVRRDPERRSDHRPRVRRCSGRLGVSFW